MALHKRLFSSAKHTPATSLPRGGQEGPVMERAPTQAYWGRVWQQFKRNRLAVMGLYVVMVLIAMALSADFLANDKPLYLVYKGHTSFPILHGYFVDLGLAPWPPELLNVDFKALPADRAIFPP